MMRDDRHASLFEKLSVSGIGLRKSDRAMRKILIRAMREKRGRGDETQDRGTIGAGLPKVHRKGFLRGHTFHTAEEQIAEADRLVRHVRREGEPRPARRVAMAGSHDRIRKPAGEIAGRLIAAQEEERRRIARELHDDISQRLALLAIEIEQLAADLPSDATGHRRWHELSRAAGDIATDLHRISHSLHPVKLEALGLVAAIDSFSQELWSSQSLVVRFTHANVPRCIPADVSLCFYRVVQESLHNIVRHSGVLEATVHLCGNERELFLRIADAGRGFVPAGMHGVGLASMRERVTSLGGSLFVHAAPGRGTRIIAKVGFYPTDEELRSE
jgi:signal transduction histidine kinase